VSAGPEGREPVDGRTAAGAADNPGPEETCGAKTGMKQSMEEIKIDPICINDSPFYILLSFPINFSNIPDILNMLPILSIGP
jgi:hypothetical protein